MTPCQRRRRRPRSPRRQPTWRKSSMPRWRSRPLPTPWSSPATFASMMIGQCGRLSPAKCLLPDASRCGAARRWYCSRCWLSACISFARNPRLRACSMSLASAVALALGTARPCPRPPWARRHRRHRRWPQTQEPRSRCRRSQPPRTHQRAPPNLRLPPPPRLPRTPETRNRCRRNQPPQTLRLQSRSSPPLPRTQRARRSNGSRAPRPARARSAVGVRSSRCTAACKRSAASASGHRMPNVNACVPPIASTDQLAAHF